MSAQLQEAPQGVTPFPGSRKVTLDLDDAAQLHSMLMRFRSECLTPGVDYGQINGTNGVALYKPGAEKLVHFFGFICLLEVTSRVENWDKGHFAYEIKAILIDKRTREVVGEGLGSCNNKERRYKNQDGANVANTILKMARKRAYIDATLTSTRSSGLFLDEDTDIEGEERPRQNQQRPPQRQQQRPQQPQRPAPQPQQPQGPQALATRTQLDRTERARQGAIALGYVTAAGTQPKPVADGATVKEAGAKCQKWEAFIREKQVETSEDLGEETAAKATENAQAAPENRKRYIIPKHQKNSPRNCTSCGEQIWFVRDEDTGAAVPVQKDGFSHFTTCPNASSHSKKPKATKRQAVESEPGYSQAAPLTNMQKRLWAVITERGLPQAKTGAEREERIHYCNQHLLDHHFDAVESFNQVSDDQARCLIAGIEAGILTWYQPGDAE